MTVQSDDGRLIVDTQGSHFWVWSADLSVQQVYDALLPLLPPPVPTAREVAEAAERCVERCDGWRELMAITGQWINGGRP